MSCYPAPWMCGQGQHNAFPGLVMKLNDEILVSSAPLRLPCDTTEQAISLND